MCIANPYGKNQPNHKGQGVISVFMYKMSYGERIEIWGDGSVARGYIYVGDVIDAAIKLAEYDGQHKIFNVGSGHGLSLLEVLAEISRVLERNPHVSFKPARPLDVPVNVLDICRASVELGWRPKTSFSQKISMMGSTSGFLQKLRTYLKIISPFPLREGVRGRGMSETEYDVEFSGDISYPHSVAPPSGGREFNFETGSSNPLGVGILDFNQERAKV